MRSVDETRLCSTPIGRLGIWLSLCWLMSGCGDLTQPVEWRNRQPAEVKSLIEDERYPDCLRQAVRVDGAHFQWMDEADTWIKAQMDSGFSPATLQKEIADLESTSLANYRHRLADLASSPGGEDFPSLPTDWPDLPPNTPDWWVPPGTLREGEVSFFDRQVSRESPAPTADVATGLCILYSQDRRTVWIWEWTMQHVRANE